MLRIKIASLFFTLFIGLATTSFAQKNFKDSCEQVVSFNFGYGYFTSEGDLNERFGNNSDLEFALRLKSRSNFTYGIQGNYIFSSEVREDQILDALKSSNGEILDRQGQISEILLFERGYNIMLEVGKVFSFKGLNPNSGLWLRVGGGFLEHKIRIESQNNDIPYLEDDYLKGYDRLTNGLALYQSIGFLNFSNSRLTNFSISFEAIEGLTQNRRDFNFDTGMRDDKKRLDIFLGFKLNWIIPVYRRMATDYYFN